MGEAVNKPSPLTLDKVHAVIAFDQPKLYAAANGANIHVRGTYLVFENGAIANPAGPISEFNIEMVLPARYPRHEPTVFEIDGRIPRSPERHINPDGSCCITVWEHWLHTAKDHSFNAYLNGPIHEFFLGQHSYEQTGSWPFGERPHGDDGLIEAYAEVLDTPQRRETVINYLRLLSQEWPKGHWFCPCGSGKRLRHCHRDELNQLHKRVEPKAAKQMLRRLLDTT